MWKCCFRELSTLPHQGRTARSVGFAELMAQGRAVRAALDSQRLLFFLLALAQWLPVGRYSSRRHPGETGKLPECRGCPSCPAPGDETSRHALLCPASDPLRWASAKRVDSLIRRMAPRKRPIRRFTVSSRGAVPSLPACEPDRQLPELLDRLRVRFSLDTLVFGDPWDRGEFAFWLTPDQVLRNDGSPWSKAWAGRFCCVVAAGKVGVALRSIRRARSAVTSPRPTRAVILAPDVPVVLALARDCGARFAGRVEGPGGGAVFLLQNEAAAHLCPVSFSTLWDLVEEGQVDPVLACPHGLRPRCRFGSSGYGAFSEWLPWLGGDVDPRLGADVAASAGLTEAVVRLGRHDHYAGLLGLLPRGLTDLIAWAYERAGATRRAAGRAADKCVRELRMTLLDGALRVYRYSDRVRDLWWRHMDGHVLAAIEGRALAAARKRARQREDAAYAKWQAQARARTLLRSRRRRVARLLGVSVAALVERHPEWRTRVPAVHEDAVRGLPPLPQFTRVAGGRLRASVRPPARAEAAGASDLSTSSDERARGRQNRPRTSLPGQVHTIFSHRRSRRRANHCAGPGRDGRPGTSSRVVLHAAGR